MRRSFNAGLSAAVLATAIAILIPGIAHAVERWIPPHMVKGSILAEYERLEGIGKSPGTPTSDELNDRQGGKFQHFINNNHIYWNSRVDPNRGRQIGGAIFDRWGQYDWENGPLGYPIQPEMDATGGKFNRFERGLIYWSPASGAHPIWGQILQTWAAAGYEQSSYGYPTSGESPIGDGFVQNFQHGSIEWHPEGFPVDWEGDSQQDDDPADNTDAFYPTCGSACANDETVDVTGHPVKSNTGSTTGRAAPEPVVTPEEGTPFCDEIVPNPTAKPDEGVICIFRDAYEPESKVNPDFGAKQAPQGPTSGVPSATESPTATSAPSTSDTPAAVPTPTTSSIPTRGSTSVTPPTSTTSTQPAPVQSEELSTSTAAVSTPTITPPATPTPETGMRNFMGTRTQSFPGVKSYCNWGDPDYQPNIWGGDRMYQCRIQTYTIGMAQASTGIAFGSILIEEMRNIKLAWNNTAWDENLGIRVQNIIPNPTVPGSLAVLQSVNIKWEFACTYSFVINCYNNGGVPTIGPMPVLTLQGGQYTTTARKGMVAPPAGYVTGQSGMRFTASASNFTTATGRVGDSPVISCDAAVGLRNTQGCAFAAITPILDYTDFAGLDDFRSHVRQAQASGLAGAVDGYALTRVVGKATIRANRAGSCGGVTGPRPTGKSCDEYPFASTNQGARVGGPWQGPGRTFPGCGITDADLTGGSNNGYSVCLIDKSQNSSAGAILGWFYAKNRILDGEAFWVHVG